jgi:hypothetical protein
MWTFTRDPKEWWQEMQQLVSPLKEDENDPSQSVDWRDIFKQIFQPMDSKEDFQSRPQTPDESSTMLGLLTSLSTRLQDAKDINSLPTSTL